MVSAQKKTRVLLFGSQGLLGAQFLYDHEEEFEIIPLARFHLDLLETEPIQGEVVKWKPDVVVNCAGWTAVDKAENPRFPEAVTTLNVTAPEEMALACKKLKIPFFHLSTDFVFGGENKETSFAEDAPKNPLSFYARSKAEGEDAVLAAYAGTSIVRTAWLYGMYGGNFVTRVRQLAKSEREVRIVNDQYGNPTWAKYVGQSLALLIRDAGAKYAPGIYHAVSEVGNTPPSWYDFAAKIFSLKPVKTPLFPITSAEFEAAAVRPISSVLQNTKLPQLPKWDEMLTEYLQPQK